MRMGTRNDVSAAADATAGDLRSVGSACGAYPRARLVSTWATTCAPATTKVVATAKTASLRNGREFISPIIALQPPQGTSATSMKEAGQRCGTYHAEDAYAWTGPRQGLCVCCWILGGGGSHAGEETALSCGSRRPRDVAAGTMKPAHAAPSSVLLYLHCKVGKKWLKDAVHLASWSKPRYFKVK